MRVLGEGSHPHESIPRPTRQLSLFLQLGLTSLLSSQNSHGPVIASGARMLGGDRVRLSDGGFLNSSNWFDSLAMYLKKVYHYGSAPQEPYGVLSTGFASRICTLGP